MNSVITHRGSEHRFETVVDSHTAVLEYVERGDALVFTHTFVPDALRGGGIAAQLTEAALQFARAHGKLVVPACSYAAAYLRKHREYAELVAPES
ncbi:MAG TPA: GNAT family N-acetyltransferase [Opitutaceae bacterium]|nr:GNAT family N-acetyltransferase [Opitutaceae bacterium]